jgi:hypothetical protein
MLIYKLTEIKKVNNMKIKLVKIKVKELYKNFNDGGEESGV